MPEYSLKYGNLISKQNLRKIDSSILKEIKRQIEKKLTHRPEAFGKPLQDSLVGYRRLRIGSFRVIYKIEDTVVKIVFIGKKPRVYEEYLKHR
jgi:mRNA interferase RelE/StbE